ncbi:39018_t:CDS:1, partial [Gigaspora margarita]
SFKKIIHTDIPDLICTTQLFKDHKHKNSITQLELLPRPLNIFHPS